MDNEEKTIIDIEKEGLATEEINVETLIPTDSYQTDPLFYAVADFFNVPKEEYPNAKDYLSEIVDFVIRDTKSNNSVDILEKLKEIESKVSPPQWGEKRYWNIRKFVRLASRKNDIERAMNAITREENA